MTIWHTGKRNTIFGGAAASAAVVAALALASPASAGPPLVEEFPIFENTCNSDRQDCDRAVWITVIKNYQGLKLQFESSPDMCSDIIAKIGSDLPQPHFVGQDRVSPGGVTPAIFIPGAPANQGGGGYNQGIYVHAVGITGGCNTGGLLEWSGKLIVTHL
jgi:hypothetical protein